MQSRVHQPTCARTSLSCSDWGSVDFLHGGNFWRNREGEEMQSLSCGKGIQWEFIISPSFGSHLLGVPGPAGTPSYFSTVFHCMGKVLLSFTPFSLSLVLPTTFSASFSCHFLLCSSTPISQALMGPLSWDLLKDREGNTALLFLRSPPPTPWFLPFARLSFSNAISLIVHFAPLTPVSQRSSLC